MFTLFVKQLKGQAKEFAMFCRDYLTIEELAHTAARGVNKSDCSQWQITAEQWQDAVIAALKDKRLR